MFVARAGRSELTTTVLTDGQCLRQHVPDAAQAGFTAKLTVRLPSRGDASSTATDARLSAPPRGRHVARVEPSVLLQRTPGKPPPQASRTIGVAWLRLARCSALVAVGP